MKRIVFFFSFFFEEGFHRIYDLRTFTQATYLHYINWKYHYISPSVPTQDSKTFMKYIYYFQMQMY